MSSDTPTTGPCDAFRDDLAQLALGTLSGKERADVIDHLEGCAGCAAELEGLSIAADALLLLAPDATPPIGFDARAVNAMVGGSERRSSVSRSVFAIAAVALVALGVGIGAIVTQPSRPAQTFTSVALSSSTGTEGNVMLSWGPQAWMMMTLDDIPASGPITCAVTMDDGHRVILGHFTVTSGYGAWAVSLKMPAKSIRSVEVLDKAGVMLASAKVQL